MRETRRHAAAAVLQAYHRGGEARAARQRWGLLTGETSIAELRRQAREHEAHMRRIAQAAHAARRLGAAGRGLLARSRTRGARLRAAQASRNIRRSLAVSGAPLLGSRCRVGRLPGLAHLTLLPHESGGGGGGGARAISVQSVERAGQNRQLPGSPHSRSPLAPLRSIAAGAGWAGASQWHDAGSDPAPGAPPPRPPPLPPPPLPPPPPPQQQQQQQQVSTGVPLPPPVTSGSDPAAPAAQPRSDPASLAAAAAAAAGSALDAAAALPAPASPGAKVSSQEISSKEIERARRSSPPLPATDTVALHARWLRRRMEMEEADATARVAEAVAAAAAATSRYREAIAERHAARRGARRCRYLRRRRTVPSLSTGLLSSGSRHPHRSCEDFRSCTAPRGRSTLPRGRRCVARRRRPSCSSTSRPGGHRMGLQGTAEAGRRLELESC